MNVAIIGTGLIGGSIGLAVKRAIPSALVTAYDRDGASAERAVEVGAADSAHATIREAVAAADVVFVATPVGAIAGALLEAASHAPPGAVLTDVGSTKSRVVHEVERSAPPTVSFIGGHPMAGTEQEGIDAARSDLFDGSWWILTPTDRSDPGAYQRLLALLTTLRARVMAIAPDEHDALLAVISHVPQLTATALMNMAAEKGREHGGVLALAAGGFRDVTRVAASNPDIWLDICRENGTAIAAALDDFAKRLLRIKALVEEGSEDDLRAELLDARRARRSLPGKEAVGDLFEVLVSIPDRPGVLAHVTTSVGNMGVNIEDLGITHSSEGGRGLLRLAVSGDEAATRVCDGLRALGYETAARRL